MGNREQDPFWQVREEVGACERLWVRLVDPAFKALSQADFAKMPSEEGEGCLCPYFWVRETKDPDAANMQLHVLKKNGSCFPVLRNKRAIEKHEALIFCEEEHETQPPKKKAKKD